MENGLKVLKIRNVFEGEFVPGDIVMKKIGRHSDAFVCIVSGCVEYIFEKKSFKGTPEKIVFLSKGSKYALRIHEKSRFVCVDFDFEESTEVRDSGAFDVGNMSVKNTFERLFRHWAEKNGWREIEAMSTVYSLYADAIRVSESESGRNGKKFSKIVRLIVENYSNCDFSVSELAFLAGVSEVHLRRIFAQSIGISPVRYINLLRLEKAKNMLLSSNYSVAEIALSTGISDQYYFSRLFKKEVGMTPSQYRRGT